MTEEKNGSKKSVLRHILLVSASAAAALVTIIVVLAVFGKTFGVVAKHSDDKTVDSVMATIPNSVYEKGYTEKYVRFFVSNCVHGNFPGYTEEQHNYFCACDYGRRMEKFTLEEWKREINANHLKNEETELVAKGKAITNQCRDEALSGATLADLTAH